MSERAAERGAERGFPRAFGRYTLLEAIPGAGMGEVSLAVSGSSVRRLCVVKTVRSDHAGHLPTVTRFLDEGRLLAALTHPNIAQILEAGVEEGTPFVAMEYISGIDLDIVMRTARAVGDTLPVDVVLTVIAHALDAIAYANNASSLEGQPLGIVHRDLGPPNIRLSWDGAVKVLDFGTALATGRSTQTLHGVMFGRPEYASPEQCRGDDLDTRSDLFTLGVVAWEMLCGKDFATGDGTEHMIAVAHGRKSLEHVTAHRRDAPPGVDRWLATMTAFEPDARFADAGTARRRLLDLAQSAGVRVDHECVARELQRLFPGHREADAERVRELAAQAPVSSPSIRAAREATTEPMGVVADPNLLRGTRYRTGALLGRGGMGEVWAAEHVDLGRTVAIKILDPETSNDPRVVERFRMEARAIAALTHPHLVHIYDLGSTEDGRLFYAMERLRGATLRERLDAARAEGAPALPVDECVRVGVAVAQGLAAAHAVGVVHRDIKPENIFLTDDGGVKLLDFGVAKTTNASIARGSSNLTVAGQVFGTPAYMSPEQARGVACDHRADLYALAAVLYECLTGSPLFPDATPVETMAQHIHAMPPSLRARRGDDVVPEALDATIMGSLAKEPAHRSQSAKDFADALARSLAAPAQAPAASMRGARAFVALALIAVIAGAPLGIWLQRRAARPSRPTADAQAEPVVSAAPSDVRATLSRGVADALAHPPLTDAPSIPPPPSLAPPPTPSLAPPPTDPVAPPPPTVTADAASAAPRDEAHGDWYSRARRELAAGHHEQAAEYAREAIRRRQHQRRARVVYGQALLNLGRRDDAIRQWRMVLAQDPDNEEAQRLLRYADAHGGGR